MSVCTKRGGGLRTRAKGQVHTGGGAASSERSRRALVLLVFTVPVAAPTAATAVETAPVATGPRVVEEIVVTSRKRKENLQDVPISITALDGELLREAAIAGVHELVRRTPNVHHGYSPCCSPVFIRGFGSPHTAGALDPTVSLVLDELSIPKDIYLSDPLFDIERFEVLRGPQGTLFGKNTPAGVFNVTTGEPTRELSGYVLGRIGENAVRRVEAAVGGPVGRFGDVARVRLAVLDSRHAEDVVNTRRREREPGTGQRAGRLRLDLDPLRSLRIGFSAERAKTDALRPFSFQLHRLPESSDQFLRQFDPAFESDGFDHRNSQDQRAPFERTTDRLQANVHYLPGAIGPFADTEFIAVLGDTGFDSNVPFDQDFSPADVLRIPAPIPFAYDQRSVELRGSGRVPAPVGLGEIDLLVGLLLFENQYRSDLRLTAGEDFEEWATSPAGFEILTGESAPGGFAAAFSGLGLDPSALPAVLEGDGFRALSDQAATSQAIFGQASWHPSERWTVSLGGRVTFEKKRAHLLFECFEPGALCTAFGSDDFELDLDRRETDFSPKVTLQYFPLESLSLFATRGTGFKSGGYNNVITTPEKVEVEEEETVSWEAGARGALFDGALAWGATLFHMDVEDLQVQQFLGGATIVVQNAEGAQSRGLELDFRWLTPWRPLRLSGAGALTDAHFEDFPDAPATRSSGATEQDLSGRRLPFVSERQAALTAELRFPLATALARRLPSPVDVSLALDAFYRSDAYLDIDLDPGARQDDSLILAARLRLAALSDALSAGIMVDNLTDADVFQFATDATVFRGFMALQEFSRNVSFDLRYAW